LTCNSGFNLGDLVEEQGSVARQLEAALAPAIGAGECAALVAEQLAFYQRLWDSGAVNRDVWSLGARGEFVNRTSGQFLSGPALARDNDRGGARRDLLDERHHAAHRERLSD